ncbi:Uncharacterized conserved protein YbgA, DUF1722 family [Clostridium cavendishii DSM 21758]|uniref:Uncharacterized conserved protein YbgA, DUF1722 family n=1 Tax=Clostridium cavendishii DSM 21758 TaxID=1121302 RepID=A0A1M6VBM8_9CLOT|nr:DUF523 and DUF1722 domain-containing protein [Clostridium cavendishii]SHK78859.1 Uncharacterized conserved protein YbgA, DUF1722 family [Clostridium cavendishii DSM 21758]
MKEWPKPTLLISKCLNDHKCRYDGSSATSDTFKTLLPYINIIEVCPEQDIGLETPREAIRLMSQNNSIHLISPKLNKDYTKQMTELADDIICKLKQKDIDGALLKSHSPSCGIKDIKIYYSDKKGSASSKGSGIFGGKLCDSFSSLPIEDEGRINNFLIREHFLTRIFTLAEFKTVYSTNKISSLLEFHAKNKLLFMAYNQTGLKKLGNIAANRLSLNIDEVFKEYYKELCNQFLKLPRYTSVINVFNHALGYFDKELNSKEKNFFNELIEKFRVGKIPQSVIINLLKSYAIRFNNDYLLSQTLLEPYPEELIDICDSGKGTVR